MVCLISDIVTPNFQLVDIDKEFLQELLAATCWVGYYPLLCCDFSPPFREIVMSAVLDLHGKKVLAAQLTAEF